ncbi:MAG: response regulator [Bacteroidetes bacterium]|nr:response regulator [Bacteroidota bacterium]
MSRENPKILIADDSPTIVDIMKFMLEASGYEVVTATNGLEAIITAFREDPDLVLLDVEMPKMNGYQVCRYLKEDRYMKQIPVIILTSHAQKKMRFLGVYTGADEYMIKDDDHEQLLNRIEYYINRRKNTGSMLKDGRNAQVTEVSVMETINSILDKKLIESTIINQVGRLAANLDRFELVVNSIFGLIEKMEEFDFSAILVRELGGAQLFIQTQRGVPQDLVDKFQARIIQSAIHAEVIMDASKVTTKLIPRTERGEFQVPDKKASDGKKDNLKFQDNLLRSRQEPVGILAVGNFSDEPLHSDIVETLSILTNHIATLLDNWLIWKRYNDVSQTLNVRLLELNVEILHDLQAFAASLSKVSNLEEMTQTVIRQIPKIIRSSKISLIIKRKVGNEFRMESFGKWGDESSTLIFDILVEWLITEQLNKITNQSIINDLSKIKFFRDHNLDKNLCHNILTVPVFVGDDKIGLISLFDRQETNQFSQQDLEILKFISGMVALSLKSVLENDFTGGESIQNNIYKRFMSDEMATTLLLNPDLIDLGGSVRHSTLLFLDLTGLDELYASIEPRRIVQFVNDFQESMTLEAFNHVGVVEKYRDHGLKVVFGIPFKQKDDAERAVQAAIAMTHRFRSLLTLYDDFPTADIELKILLHCGDVVTAQIGSENRKDFACFGTASTQANLIMRMLDRMGIYLTDRVIMELEHPYGLNPTNLNTGTEVQIYQMADY